jgi:thymidylate kinase
MIITIDGIDGVGKSKLAEKLKVRLNAKVIHGVPRLPSETIDCFDLNSRYLSRLAEYLRRDLAIQDDAERIFVVDRSVRSTMAQYRALPVHVVVENVLDLLPPPAVSIYLTCPTPRWRQVLSDKAERDWFERKLLADQGLAERVEAEYDGMGLRRISNDDLDVTVENVLTLIRQS